MPKVNFTKVEKAFDTALEKLFIDNLSELAALVTVSDDPEAQISNKALTEVIERFRKELKKIKKQDPKLFEKLNLSPEEEKRLTLPMDNYKQEDWLRLKTLKERIDTLKRELHGEEVIKEEFDQQVDTERKRHVNKRLNVRDGWLPLR